MKKSDFSKQLISEALLILMKKKHISKINIKEISEKAGVSRLTFYRNFEAKEDILKWHFSQGIDEFMTNINDRNLSSLREVIIYCFDYWYGKKEEIKCYVEQNLSYILSEPFGECMDSIFEKINVDATYTPTQKRFVLGGLFANMLICVLSPTPMQSEKIADDILDMFQTKFLV